MAKQKVFDRFTEKQKHKFNEKQDSGALDNKRIFRTKKLIKFIPYNHLLTDIYLSDSPVFYSTQDARGFNSTRAKAQLNRLDEYRYSVDPQHSYKAQAPEALFEDNKDVFLIRETRQAYIWDSVFFDPYPATIKVKNPNSKQGFDVYKIVTLQGNSMAKAKEILIQNGDTEDWVRLDFETFSQEGKIILASLKTTLTPDVKNFDFSRKCWFIHKDVLDPFLAYLKVLITHNTIQGWVITDNRESIEAFDEFFNNPEPEATPAKTKATLVGDFIECLKSAKLDQALIMSAGKGSTIELKPLYRKAALALHPDRNNGDSTKMVELNLVWQQLQEYN